MIEAQGKSGRAAVKQFEREITIAYSYDLEGIGVDEASLSWNKSSNHAG